MIHFSCDSIKAGIEAHIRSIIGMMYTVYQVVKPRPVQAASIPGMLGMFQNFLLDARNGTPWCYPRLHQEKQLHSTRQELSHCLYQLGFLLYLKITHIATSKAPIFLEVI